MIVTLTANPSLDRTVSLPGPLARGQVQRALTTTSDPGGKGVNVARVVTAAGQTAVAVLPGHHEDPLLLALRGVGITHRPVPVDGRVRVNLTLTEPDGTTTKVNEPGLELDADVREALTEVLVREAAGARWVALSGSLPPGVPLDWYAELTDRLRATGAKVALDTSGDPLLASLRRGHGLAARPRQAQRRGARRAHRPARRRPRARPRRGRRRRDRPARPRHRRGARHPRRRRRAARHP